MDSITIPFRANRLAGVVIAGCSAPLALIAVGALLAEVSSTSLVGTAVFGGLFSYGLLLIWASRRPERMIILSDTHLTAPAGAISHRMSDIALVDINRLIWFPKHLGVLHRGGLLWIAKASLPNNADYDRLYEALKRRIS
ncbi:MAG: hypothetical protein AAFU41_15225 [Pseudomonadota bacterium]